MTAGAQLSSSAERLRASPSFALAFTLDGRAYVAKETEPYIQYWLNDRYRILLAMFSRRGGATVAEAMEGYLRLTRVKHGGPERKRLQKAIDDMREGGVLMGSREDTSRYDARMAQDYLTHRPFPRELSDLIIQSAPVAKETRVLDLAGGPGGLAMALARASDDVSLMDLSRGFVNAARARAKRLGLKLTAIHESCNRLMFMDDAYDVVTVSQALHWLDDVLVCRGVCRVLKPGGSFFVIHSAMDLDDAHPLSPVFGNRSILGHKNMQPFASQVQTLMRRLSLLFAALDAPDVNRNDPRWHRDDPAAGPVPQIVPVGACLFRQRRPFDMGYARAFLTPRHIASAGHEPSTVWKDLEARCAGATPEQTLGAFDWALLHFTRGAARTALPPLESREAMHIDWEGPAAA
jgi:ubiquinone/menaquinone biosynthesis C-methylase UbiE